MNRRRLATLSTAVAFVLLGMIGATPAGAAPTPAPASVPWPQFFDGGYNPVAPTRLVDTREGRGGGSWAPGESRVVDVAGTISVPTELISGYVLNVTAVTPTADTFLTVWNGSPQYRPDGSNVNAPAGVTVANNVIVGSFASDGNPGGVVLYNHNGTTEVVIDITGWYGFHTRSNSHRFFPLPTPVRWSDTRPGTGPYTLKTEQAPLQPGETRFVAVDDDAVGDGRRQFVFNVTAVSPSADSFLTLWANGSPRPATSSLNLTGGRTVANLAIANETDGFWIYNHAGTVDVVLDIVALTHVRDNSEERPGILPREYRQIDAARLADTRRPADGPSLARGEARRFPVTGMHGVPTTGVGSVVLNVVAVEPTANTFLTLWAGSTPRPTVSSLNAAPGSVVTNLVHAPVNADGTITVFNHDGRTHVVLDIVGWYSGEPETVAAGTIIVDAPENKVFVFDRPGIIRSATFTAVAGTQLFMRRESFAPIADYLTWRVLGPDGSVVIEDYPLFVAPMTGTYTMELAALDGYTGSVGFGWSTTYPYS